MPKKIRVYTFQAVDENAQEMGNFSFTAKNMDEAESHRWQLHNDPNSGIRCAGYVGPMNGGKWEAADTQLGFESFDDFERKRRAAMPEVEHDPIMLAEFVERTGKQPERGNVLRRNLLSNGVFEIDPNTSAACDPSTETYHSI